jgi:hypothetical protein
MNRIENEALGIAYDLPELTQGRMEDFWLHRRNWLDRIEGEPSGAEVNGAIVRVLARLGWLEGVEETDVPEMKPAVVMFIAAEFSRIVAEAYAIPGE